VRGVEVGEVVVRVAEHHVAKEIQVLIDLVAGRHVRVVDRELGDGACGRPLPREGAVRRRLRHEPERAGHAHREEDAPRKGAAGSVARRRARTTSDAQIAKAATQSADSGRVQ
jgi:hypothetical protein